MPVYLQQHANTLSIGNDAIEGILDLSGTSAHLAALTNKLTGHHYALRDIDDCTLRFSAAAHRIDIPKWSFRLGSAAAVPHEDDEGYKQRLFAPDVDVTNWLTAAGLNEYPVGAVGYTTVVYPGYAWYRQAVVLPEEGRGQTIALVLGGCDDQDWLEYWVYMNGVLIGHAAPGTQRWHPAPHYTLRPGDAAHSVLRFGAQNTLAVQARGLDRRSPGMVQSNLERYSVETPLFDQVVTVGEPYRDVSRFHLVSHTRTEHEDLVAIDVVLTDGEQTSVDVRYWVSADEPVLYKQVRVRNTGREPQTLLEVDVHRLASDASVSAGGWGEVCILGDDVFCGVQHPAGISQGQRGEVHLRLLPGAVLQPGEHYESKVAVIGAGQAGEGQQSFLGYLERRGRRRREVLSLYSPYGIYDYAGTEPSEVTEQLILDNLECLEKLQERGITFDYYAIDTGWNNPTGDLKDFDPRTFPAGPARILARMRDLGMKPGLWVSPSHGPAAFRPQVIIPQLEPCRTLPSGPGQAGREDIRRPEGGVLCLAAEPYRSLFRDALLYHVRHNGVRCFKMDGVRLLCNNPNHGHLPGKYSVETLADALIDTVTQVHKCRADSIIIWYWGVRSPWWLLHGATLYEHGIHMEAATPADIPSMLLRQSVTISLDQGTDYAWNRVPLPCQDSLGVWISNTRWGNWMKSEGWQDAWVMDLARGSMLVQLWGDVALFDDEDLDFLARMSAWLREHAGLLAQTRRILASPWSGDPYGYAHFNSTQGMIAIHNPGFTQRFVTIGLGQEAGPLHDDRARQYAITCLHPRQRLSLLAGCHDLTVGDAFTLALAPFQVVMLQIQPVTPGEIVAFPTVSTQTERSRRLACQLEETSREPFQWVDTDSLEAAVFGVVRSAINGRAQYVDTAQSVQQILMCSDPRDQCLENRRMAGHLTLPVIQARARLCVIAQLSRESVYWHHHALFDIIRLQVTLDGHEVPVVTIPKRWHEQAGGWSWIAFQVPLEPTSGTTNIDLDVRLCLPTSVDVCFSSWLVKEEE